MELFITGFIIGMLISILIIVVLIFFKNPIETKINIIEKNISNAGPRPRGFIIEPIDESEEVRQEIIRKNRERGLDTPIKDLR